MEIKVTLSGDYDRLMDASIADARFWSRRKYAKGIMTLTYACESSDYDAAMGEVMDSISIDGLADKGIEILSID